MKMNFYSSSKEERFRMFNKSTGGNTIDNNGAPASPAPPKIQKVPMLLRDNKNLVEYFEPRVVSLGPIHHGNEKYRHAEMLKLKLAIEFVRNSGMISIEKLCDAIEKHIKKLKECFEEEVTNKFKDDYLAWIFVVDGCAILQFMRGEFKEINMKMDCVLTSWIRDMFLLENQVPYYLLDLLMSLSQVRNEMVGMIAAFVFVFNFGLLMNMQLSLMEQALQQSQDERKWPIHLLDLVRRSLLGLDDPKRVPNGYSIEFLRTNHQQLQKGMEKFLLNSHRKVQELKAAGIRVERSATNSLRDISFGGNKYRACLRLPPLRVDNISVPRLLNLIAYEMCPDFKNDMGVTFFIYFYNSLIDGAKDVKELVKARVLYNYLNHSYEEVAQLLHSMCSNLVPNDDFFNIQNEIQKYFDNNSLIWMAELFYDIFSRPWKVVAFFSTLFALLLTATQTIFSIWPRR